MIALEEEEVVYNMVLAVPLHCLLKRRSHFDGYEHQIANS
jgi:hypothetical protein